MPALTLALSSGSGNHTAPVWLRVTEGFVFLFTYIRDLNKKRLTARRDRKSKIDADIDAQLVGLGLKNIKENILKSFGSPIPASNGCVIYSTYCGPTNGMSLAVQAPERSENYYFISNNPECLIRAERLGWLPIFINLPIIDDPVLSSAQAKIAKALPHLFPELDRFRFSIYFDDKQTNYSKYFDALYCRMKTSNAALSVTRHPFLSGNILLEFGEAMLQKRYARQRKKISQFIMEKISDGYSLECTNMFATGLIARDHRAPQVRAINEEWYQAIEKCGIECQISFDILAQRYDCIDCFGLSELL